MYAFIFVKDGSNEQSSVHTRSKRHLEVRPVLLEGNGLLIGTLCEVVVVRVGPDVDTD